MPSKPSRRAERRVREHLQAQGYLVLRTRPTDLADFVAMKRAGECRTAVTLVRVTKARPARREVARLLREARFVGASLWVATVPRGGAMEWRRVR